MNFVQKLSARLQALFSKRQIDAEMEEEMRSHVEMRTQENVSAGMTPDAARVAAMREFGWTESIKETCRDQRGLGWIENFVRDIRYGLRMLGKNPGFTAIAVMVLAFGIGANATIFSIINSILVKPINAVHPEQLVGVFQHEKDRPDAFQLYSYPDFADLRRGQAAAFTDLFAFHRASVGMQGDLTEKVWVDFVSANYFPALGVAPTLGRWFLSEEETSQAPVAVLTERFWRRLGGDPSIVGRKLKLTRGEVTVVGVMPRGFTGAQWDAPAMFFPVGIAPILNPDSSQQASQILTDRGDRSFMVMGRLKPGLSLANVDGAIAGLNQQFAIPDPAKPIPRTLICTKPSRFNFSSDPPKAIDGLASLAGFAFGLSMLVLVIACLNLANMMLARGAARQKEVAIRLAIGAGRSTILRQLLTEGLILTMLGGAAGLVVSMWANKILAAFVYGGAGMPSDFPVFDLAPDFKELAILLLVSAAATIFFALAPAWKLARIDFNSDLKRNTGDEAGKSRERRFGARELLAVGQMGFTLALLVAAALFSRSAINAAKADPGFEFGSNFYVSIDTTLTGYPEKRVRELVGNATDRLAALPGVESVSPAMNIPFGNGQWDRHIQIGGAPPPSDAAATLAEGKELYTTFNVVGADYFRTLGIPLQRGREFERRETEPTHTAPVAIISQKLAEQLWPGQEALGRTVQFPAYAPGIAPTVMTVVGVVPEIHWQLFENGPLTQIYVPFGQYFQAEMNLHVRVAPGVNPKTLMTTAREELHKLDPQIPLTDVKTLAGLHRDGPWVRITRLGSILFGAFGGLAVFLSLLGIYGLKAYAVARRTREIGIRIALGANRGDVTAMILRESVWLALVGLGLGVSLAIAVGKLSARFLYHVPALDLGTFIIIPALLLAIVMVACWFPARRAARVDPMKALRCD
ncbi:MAG TPA: ABC transporter permease [Verrucomicrobiae bacterium]|jgi:predicted permease